MSATRGAPGARGVSALTRLRAYPTQLVVVLDWLMLRMDGVAALQAIARDAPGAQRHIYLLLTSSEQHVRPPLATLSGGLSVTVVGRSFDLDDLLALVDHAARDLRR